MKKTMKVIAATFVILFLSSCVYRAVDCTVVSTKNVDLSRMPEFYRGYERVSGQDSRPIILIFPIGFPSAKTAIDEAIESVTGAVALVDGVLEVEEFYIPLLFGATTYRVRGTPLIDPKLRKDAVRDLVK